MIKLVRTHNDEVTKGNKIGKIINEGERYSCILLVPYNYNGEKIQVNTAQTIIDGNLKEVNIIGYRIYIEHYIDLIKRDIHKTFTQFIDNGNSLLK